VLSSALLLVWYPYSPPPCMTQRDAKLDTEAILSVLSDAVNTLPPREVPQFTALTQPLTALAQRWAKGAAGVNRDGLVDLLRRFLAVESHFGGAGRERRFDDVVFELRQGGGG
jgi:hypothetical protein